MKKINAWWLMLAVVLSFFGGTLFMSYAAWDMMNEGIAQAKISAAAECRAKAAAAPLPSQSAGDLVPFTPVGVPLAPVGHLMCWTEKLSPEALAQLKDVLR